MRLDEAVMDDALLESSGIVGEIFSARAADRREYPARGCGRLHGHRRSLRAARIHGDYFLRREDGDVAGAAAGDCANAACAASRQIATAERMTDLGTGAS
jgi:hypothetical protein